MGVDGRKVVDITSFHPTMKLVFLISYLLYIMFISAEIHD